jgi:hypothetical protein
MSRIRNARIVRSDNDPSFRAMDEHVRDVSCHPMSAAGIEYAIAFPGLNHSHLAEDADRSLIYNVLERMRGAADRCHDGRLIVGMLIEPASPIISYKASYERAVRVHVCLSPAPIECEKGVTKSGVNSSLRNGLRGKRPGHRSVSKQGKNECCACAGD